MLITIEVNDEEIDIIVQDLKKNLRTHQGRKGHYNPEALKNSYSFKSYRPDYQRELEKEYAEKYEEAVKAEKVVQDLLDKIKKARK